MEYILLPFVHVLWTLSAVSLTFMSVRLDRVCHVRTAIKVKGQMSPDRSLFCV